MIRISEQHVAIIAPPCIVQETFTSFGPLTLLTLIDTWPQLISLEAISSKCYLENTNHV
jgi:hypothetical protein